MSVNQKIIEALAPLGIPAVPDVYTGAEDSYCVFGYSTIPAWFGDDSPGIERYLVQVHLYCPLGKSSLSLRADIKRLLFEADLSWPTMENATATGEERDKDAQHYIFECEYVGGVGGG